jgi:hypothetical protein
LVDPVPLKLALLEAIDPVPVIVPNENAVPDVSGVALAVVL